MKILVTGASGFTGQRFITFSERLKHEVLKVKSDLGDMDSIVKEIAFYEFDYVINFAAISSPVNKDINSFYNVNLIGTFNLLSALKNSKKKFKKILLISSAQIYGDNDGVLIPETSPAKPSNHYALSKLSMEIMAKNFFPAMPVVIARPFNYTGAGQSENFVIPKIISHFKNKIQILKLGNLFVEREYNDVDFVCYAYLQLLTHGSANEIYNVCSGKTYNLLNIINFLEELTNFKPTIQVDNSLLRASEISRLAGDPSKISNLFFDDQYKISLASIKILLSDMLKN
jgi:nucleoside-diphosphate-sugar epimerase